MLSHLNTLIGFAALFAILSLLVTSLTQIVRMVWRTRTRALIDRLMRLFGELKDPERFVAAILSHPTLEGGRGARWYQTLIDPTADQEETDAAAAVVLGKFNRLWPVPWARTVDLDKQTIKDIGQTVYEYIGHVVDYEIASSADRTVQSEKGPRVDWAQKLKAALDKADLDRLKGMTASKGPSIRSASSGAPSATVVIPFRGRMWMLATSAFPEAEGKTPPLKTYVAAFHDEAAASASDRQTWWIRISTVIISLLLALFLQLDALQVWKNLAQADPAKIEALVKASQSIEAVLKARTDNTAPTASIADANPAAVPMITEAVQEELKSSLASSPFNLQPNWPWKLNWLKGFKPLLGLLLAVASLSLGAPFWFEALKSAINLKSAFSKDKGK
jgi:hypothetical protein